MQLHLQTSLIPYPRRFTADVHTRYFSGFERSTSFFSKLQTPRRAPLPVLKQPRFQTPSSHLHQKASVAATSKRLMPGRNPPLKPGGGMNAIVSLAVDGKT